MGLPVLQAGTVLAALVSIAPHMAHAEPALSGVDSANAPREVIFDARKADRRHTGQTPQIASSLADHSVPTTVTDRDSEIIVYGRALPQIGTAISGSQGVVGYRDFARKFGTSLAGLTVAVQGIGNVGMRLCELLHDVGARLIVADPRADMTQSAVDRFDAKVADGDAILSADCDVFAPCALGGILDRQSVAALRAGLVCGGANNQLQTPEDGERLAERGILYAPDYVVNAGGVINVAAEYLGWSNAEVTRRVDAIGEKLAEVFEAASADGLTSNIAADRLARKMIERKRIQDGKDSHLI